MSIDPLARFQEWYAAAQTSSPLRHPGAVCVSTVDEAGVPDARFVDLKEVSEGGFVFSTQLESAKARQLAAKAAVALTFWWDHLERQVRVVGTAVRVADSRADAIFRERSRSAQLASWASQQSAPLTDAAALEQQLHAAERRFAGREIARPPGWIAFRVVPARMEFLTFRDDRMHERVLYYLDAGAWQTQRLQP